MVMRFAITTATVAAMAEFIDSIDNMLVKLHLHFQ